MRRARGEHARTPAAPPGSWSARADSGEARCRNPPEQHVQPCSSWQSPATRRAGLPHDGPTPVKVWYGLISLGGGARGPGRPRTPLEAKPGVAGREPRRFWPLALGPTLTRDGASAAADARGLPLQPRSGSSVPSPSAHPSRLGFHLVVRGGWVSPAPARSCGW